ncbi:MAG: orotidine 5'-phosphate decarboxylase / HUMPS family protein [Candidatus Margulisiibacteriota bacterium]
MTLIAARHCLIPSCDVDLPDFERLVKDTADLPGIGAYKLGFELGLAYGLPRVVEVARRYTDKPMIYDHQKAATDIPDTGAKFAKVVKKAGINSVILFPQAGPITEAAWIKASRDEGLHVMVGGLMTHQGYAASDGGYLSDVGIWNMYRVAAKAGVRDFVIPGTKPDAIKPLLDELAVLVDHPVYYSPGLGTQGGSFATMLSVVKAPWHPIVGRSLYTATNYREAAQKLIAEFEAAL